MILTLLLAIAVLAALAGAYRHNLTSYALLGSFTFSTGLCWAEVPFNLILWLVVDLVVILFMMRPEMNRRDLVILALFAPIWTLYLAQPTWAPPAVDCLIAAQMLLTFPVRRAHAAVKRWLETIQHHDNMKMVAA
jgi:signal transduction histidine kinase